MLAQINNFIFISDVVVNTVFTMYSVIDYSFLLLSSCVCVCLLRFTDVSPGIRVECVRYSKYFLVYHSHLSEDAAQQLHDRFYDREERVRLEVVKTVCEAAADNFDAVPKQVSLVTLHVHIMRTCACRICST